MKAMKLAGQCQALKVVLKSLKQIDKCQKGLFYVILKKFTNILTKSLHYIKRGFSKFAELRPKHCILAEQSETNSVCVCTTHQNITLTIESTVTNGNLTNYYQCIAKMLSNPSSVATRAIV